MKVSLPNSLLLLAATVCFAESFYCLQNSGAEPLLTAALGILLLLRGFAAAPQPAAVVLSGCILAALSVGRDQGFLNDNSPAWMGLFILAGAVIMFWQRIEKLWK